MTKKIRSPKNLPLSPVLPIESRILFLRGQKVMLDAHLAELYNVPIGRLNEAVKRNMKRFPEDFMFRLTTEEGRSLDCLRSQTAILKRGQHRKYSPYVFTEQGVAMLSSVLNSVRAIAVNIAIMRAFVKLREVMTTHKELATKIEALETRFASHDKEIQVIFEAIKTLLAPPQGPPKNRIGFKTAPKK